MPEATSLDHTNVLKTVEVLWGLPPLTDDPLAGVTVPTSGTAFPGGDAPSHLQTIHAELVSRLPVADSEGAHARSNAGPQHERRL